MEKLPNKINVAGIDYEVKEVDGLAYKHDHWGKIYYENGLIEIDSSICQSRKEQTFVHEMLHAVFTEAGYEEHEEEMITRVSNVLYQVLKDNDISFQKGVEK